MVFATIKQKLLSPVLFGQNQYAKISEPRLPKVTGFLIYLSTGIGGIIAFLGLPPLLVQVIGPMMVGVFGTFGFIGSFLGLIAIFPGVVWLERVGLILLLTSIVMYLIMLIYITVSTIALWLVIPLAITLVRRLIDMHFRLHPDL